MAVQSSPVLLQTPKMTLAQFSTATAISTGSTSAYTTLYTGGVNGSKVTSVLASNTSSQSTINAILTIGSTVSGASLNYVIAAQALVGVTDITSNVVSINLLSASVVPLPIDGDGQSYLFLASTAHSLQVGIGSSIQSTGGRISIVAIGADF